MKVFIVGSMRCREKMTQEEQNDYAIKKTQFRSACRALGAAFAGKNHQIIVGVPGWQMLRERFSVATFVVEGAHLEPPKEGKKHSVIFYTPRTPEPADATKGTLDSLSELKRLSNIDVAERAIPGRGDYAAKSIPKIADVDAVVLIGGAEGTASIGYAAFAMDKPCIALTSLGGAAYNLCEDVLLEEHRRFVNRWLGRTPRITDKDLSASHVEWCDDEGTEEKEEKTRENRANADKIVTLTEKLVKASNLDKTWSSGILTVTLAGVVVLLLAWLLLYVQFPQYLGLPPIVTPISFFLLLYCSALLGAGLRILTSYQGDTTTQVTFSDLSIEAVIALLVAFGLALLYLIGGISFTGKVVALDQTQSEAVNSISVTMSLLGLAAGFVVPIDQLRESLVKTVSDKGK